MKARKSKDTAKSLAFLVCIAFILVLITVMLHSFVQYSWYTWTDIVHIFSAMLPSIFGYFVLAIMAVIALYCITVGAVRTMQNMFKKDQSTAEEPAEEDTDA